MDQRNKSIAFFLIRFFGTYLLLFLLYSFYLKSAQVREGILSCAPMTTSVADKTERVLNFVGFSSEVVQSETDLAMNLWVRDVFIARIIEGCNSASIIILFISFIVGFAGKFRTTLLYIIIGSIIIYTANIFRIAAIALALYKFPDYQYVLHDLLFPTLIYGLTFLLWIIWIKFFYYNQEK